jgi:RNA polymerase sigma factor (TIGR02999 family)
LLASESVTSLLIQWSHGDESALEKLTPLVYDELHRLAANYLRNQRPDHTLQATALVHEAYLQLLDLKQIEWNSRAHFIGLAAQMMRCVLVDHARKRAAEKRGGGALKVSLSRAQRAVTEREVNLIALDEALEKFAQRFPRQAKVIELHFFGGLNMDEIPALLSVDGIDVSQRTVERDLKFARAWLLKEIGND